MKVYWGWEHEADLQIILQEDSDWTDMYVLMSHLHVQPWPYKVNNNRDLMQ
jgi:hypothetical protein